MTLTIRAFNESDTQDVIKLWRRAGLTRPWNDPLKDILRKLTVQAEWFLVGEIDETIVASLMAGYDGHRGWLNYLAVDPDEQRKGYARLIVRHAEQLLKDAGCPKINLQIRKDNEQAVAFYQRIGFGEDAVVSYGKRLERDGET